MYFLGIVMEKDVLSGNISPTFVLCYKKRFKENRTGLLVKRVNKQIDNSLLLVPSVLGYDFLIDYLSHYRFMVRTSNHKNARLKNPYRKIYPKGCLFWFECTGTGNLTGVALYIKHIPDKSYSCKHDQGCHFVYDELNKEFVKKTLTELNDSELNSDVYKIEEIKKELPQLERHSILRHKRKELKND